MDERYRAHQATIHRAANGFLLILSVYDQTVTLVAPDVEAPVTLLRHVEWDTAEAAGRAARLKTQPESEGQGHMPEAGSGLAQRAIPRPYIPTPPRR